MNHASDATTAGNGSHFDPQQAASLLEQTTQEARRKLQPAPPWLLVTRGVLVLAALGAIWLSVRGQHPYRGPTGADVAVLVTFIVVNFVATITVRRRATAGITGPSRFTQAEIAVLATSFAVAIVVMVGLSGAGVKVATYPTSVLVLPGLAWAVLMAIRANRREVGTGLMLMAIGIVGGFAGQVDSWAVAAVGLCVLLLGRAAAVAWQPKHDGRS